MGTAYQRPPFCSNPRRPLALVRGATGAPGRQEKNGPAPLSGQALLVCGVFLPSAPQSKSSARSRYVAMLSIQRFAGTIWPFEKTVFFWNS